MTVLRSILSGKTYISCHGDAEFNCQTNDGCFGTEWYGDVVNVAKDLELGREERTFDDVIKEAYDLEIDGKEITLGDVAVLSVHVVLDAFRSRTWGEPPAR